MLSCVHRKHGTGTSKVWPTGKSSGWSASHCSPSDTYVRTLDHHVVLVRLTVVRETTEHAPYQRSLRFRRECQMATIFQSTGPDSNNIIAQITVVPQIIVVHTRAVQALLTRLELSAGSSTAAKTCLGSSLEMRGKLPDGSSFPRRPATTVKIVPALKVATDF